MVILWMTRGLPAGSQRIWKREHSSSVLQGVMWKSDVYPDLVESWKG